MKQATISRRNILVLIVALMVAVGFAAVLTTDTAQAKTKNKAVKVGMSFTGDPYQGYQTSDAEEIMQPMVDNSYSVRVTMKGQIVPNEEMKWSGKLYIPKTLLSKPGDTFIAVPVADFSNGVDDGFYIEGKYAPVISNIDGTPILKLYDETGEVQPGNMAKLTQTKSKKFYLLQLKDFPMSALPKDGPEKIPADKAFTASMIFSVSGYGEQSGAFLYVDDLKLTAAKSLKASFNKKDYQSILPFRTFYEKHQLPYELATVK